VHLDELLPEPLEALEDATERSTMTLPPCCSCSCATAALMRTVRHAAAPARRGSTAAICSTACAVWRSSRSAATSSLKSAHKAPT
jgi:hypothetical protein